MRIFPSYSSIHTKRDSVTKMPKKGTAQTLLYPSCRDLHVYQFIDVSYTFIF